ncbi:MAG: Trm112 family protein [Elusimicrobia bacterium]|nr:Trm112 family protein [Elusimicrobiota bacterium]
MTLDPELLEILACPACKAPLEERATPSGEPSLACAACGRRYPIEDGVPVLLVDPAPPK